MKKNLSVIRLLSACIFIAILITDTETAITGASSGINICIQVLIPTLLPFFVATSYLRSASSVFKSCEKTKNKSILPIPSGARSILILGLIGGYPIGAQLIADAYKRKSINKETAQILLGYCSNAGPAFIFGVISPLFESILYPAILWGIQIISAVITGILLPKPFVRNIQLTDETPLTFVDALQNSIRSCAYVSGWVIIFKTILAYIEKWLTGTLPSLVLTILTGMLELSNGCLKLSTISALDIRFILCAVFLSFGGICVLLQTHSVAGSLGLGLYIPGKVIQTVISTLLSSFCAFCLFADVQHNFIHLCTITIVGIMIIWNLKSVIKKRCGKNKESIV